MTEIVAMLEAARTARGADDLATAIDRQGVEIDEFGLAGIETLPSALVKPDRVAASPVQFECRHTQTLRLTSAAGAETDAWLILGEVVGVHIDEAMIVDGNYDTARAAPVLRGGGWGDYFELGELIRIRRPG